MSFPDWRVKEQQRIQAAIDARDPDDPGTNRRAAMRRAAREERRVVGYEESGHDVNAGAKAYRRFMGSDIASKILGYKTDGDGNKIDVRDGAPRKRPNRKGGRGRRR